MVLVREKAVGAEYLYTGHYSTPLEKEQRVIRKRHKISLAYKVAAGILSISCLFMIGLAYTSLKAGKARLNWELNQVKQANTAITTNIEKIKLDIAALKSPERIEQIAVTELGMVKNPRIEYLVMNNVFGENQESTGQNIEVPQEQKTEIQQTGEKNDSIFRKMSTLLTQ